jgi:hypothetical protein
LIKPLGRAVSAIEAEEAEGIDANNYYVTSKI